MLNKIIIDVCYIYCIPLHRLFVFKNIFKGKYASTNNVPLFHNTIEQMSFILIVPPFVRSIKTRPISMEFNTF